VAGVEALTAIGASLDAKLRALPTGDPTDDNFTDGHDGGRTGNDEAGS
jgi:hypothetical protein